MVVNCQLKLKEIKKPIVTHSPLNLSLQRCIFLTMSMSIEEKIGSRLKQLRAERGLSQEKFSFKCDLDRTYIAGIEKGKRNVSAVNIEKIAKAFDMSIFDFFNFKLFQ